MKSKEEILEELEVTKNLYLHDGSKIRALIAQETIDGIKSPKEDANINIMSLKGNNSGQEYEITFLFSFHEKEVTDKISFSETQPAFGCEYGNILGNVFKKDFTEQHLKYFKELDGFYNGILDKMKENGDTEFEVLRTIKYNTIHIK